MKKWITLALMVTLFLSVWVVAFFIEPSLDNFSINKEKREEPVAESEKVPIGDIKNLFLTVDEEDLDYLYTRDRNDDTRINASVTVDQQSVEHPSELRFRGNSSRGLPKKSLSIRFDSGKDFIAGGTHMNLNAMYTDPTMMREKIAFDMFHEVGLPAPQTEYFNLYVNGVFEGVYIHIDRVDEHLLSQLGLNPRGTLVRDEFRHNQKLDEVETSSIFSFDITSVENRKDFLSGTTSYRNKPDWDKFSELLEWVYQTEAGQEFAQEFGEYVEKDSFIDWLAIHFLVGDVDAFADDYWMYLDPDAEGAKWQLLPWDKDLSFGSHYRTGAGTGNHYFAYESPIQSRFDNQLLQKFLATPELRAELDARLVHLMEETFSPAYYEEKVKDLSKVLEMNLELHNEGESFKLHRRNTMGEPRYETYYRENILDFVDLRYQYMSQYLNGFEDQPYTATVGVGDAQPGDVLYFRDGKGWVIAKLEVESVFDASEVTIRVRQDDISPDIDRVWTIDTDGEEIEGNLTLFYRNDIGWIGKENWYHEDTPIGEQWGLSLAILQENGESAPIESQINPYSNKVRTKQSIKLQGTQEFIIFQP